VLIPPLTELSKHGPLIKHIEGGNLITSLELVGILWVGLIVILNLVFYPGVVLSTPIMLIDWIAPAKKSPY
jgi:hypothetical protein